jgi:PhnB protein
MVKAGTHLHFEGQCAEAFRFYAQCLNGKIAFSMTWGDSPMAKDMPGEMKDKIIHARLEFGDQFLTADDPPPKNYTKPQGFHVLLLFKEPSEAERVYGELSQGAREIKMAFAKTFWSPGFATFVDRFGTPWMINCEPKTQTQS